MTLQHAVRIAHCYRGKQSKWANKTRAAQAQKHIQTHIINCSPHEIMYTIILWSRVVVLMLADFATQIVLQPARYLFDCVCVFSRSSQITLNFCKMCDVARQPMWASLPFVWTCIDPNMCFYWINNVWLSGALFYARRRMVVSVRRSRAVLSTKSGDFAQECFAATKPIVTGMNVCVCVNARM